LFYGVTFLEGRWHACRRIHHAACEVWHQFVMGLLLVMLLWESYTAALTGLWKMLKAVAKLGQDGSRRMQFG
jgi:hypothetical protein